MFSFFVCFLLVCFLHSIPVPLYKSPSNFFHNVFRQKYVIQNANTTSSIIWCTSPKLHRNSLRQDSNWNSDFLNFFPGVSTYFSPLQRTHQFVYTLINLLSHIRKASGRDTQRLVLCKITVRRSKYCLKFLKLQKG